MNQPHKISLDTTKVGERVNGSIPARTLVMTATINAPAGVPMLIRTDPKTRLQDYCAALAYYIAMPDEVIDHVVFAENSGADLTELRAVATSQSGNKRVDILSLPGLDHPPQFGRGYGEFKLLDRVMARLAADPANCEPHRRIWKVTGRYQVRNLGRLVATAPKSYALYCDMRNRPIPWLDLRLFSCTLAGYQRYLHGLYDRLREDLQTNSPEVLMRDIVGRSLGNNDLVPRFRVEPHVDGIRGWDNRNYMRGKPYLKVLFRAAIRRTAPWLWV